MKKFLKRIWEKILRLYTPKCCAKDDKGCCK
jgi:hypothetical protein